MIMTLIILWKFVSELCKVTQPCFLRWLYKSIKSISSQAFFNFWGEGEIGGQLWALSSRLARLWHICDKILTAFITFFNTLCDLPLRKHLITTAKLAPIKKTGAFFFQQRTVPNSWLHCLQNQCLITLAMHNSTHTAFSGILHVLVFFVWKKSTLGWALITHLDPVSPIFAGAHFVWVTENHVGDITNSPIKIVCTGSCSDHHIVWVPWHIDVCEDQNQSLPFYWLCSSLF